MSKITHPRLTKKLIVIVFVVLLVTAGVVVAMRLTSDNEPGSSLAVQEPITIAGNRYLSACQILPESAVSSAFGKFGEKSYYRETSLSRSLTADEVGKASFGSVDTSCLYYLKDSVNKAVSLSIAQYKDATSAREDWQTAVSLGDGTYERKLAQFEQTLAADQAAGKTNAAFDQNSKDLIEFMKQSLPKAKREAGTTVAGLDKSIIFNDDRSEFIAVYKNSVLTLKYEFGSADPFDSSRAISASELRDVLGPVQTAFNAMFKNLDNNASQSPAPTLRVKTVTKVGDTKILEPCELLDATMFIEIFGKPATDPLMERESLTLSSNKDRTHVDGYPIFDGNSCLRRYTDNFDSTPSATLANGSVELTLRYAKSNDVASQYVTGVTKSLSDNFTSPDFKKVSTDAALAYFRNTKDGSLVVQIVRFQKDGYAGEIAITKNNNDGDSQDISQSDFVKAVNLIVKQLP